MRWVRGRSAARIGERAGALVAFQARKQGDPWSPREGLGQDVEGHLVWVRR